MKIPDSDARQGRVSNCRENCPLDSTPSVFLHMCMYNTSKMYMYMYIYLYIYIDVYMGVCVRLTGTQINDGSTMKPE